MSYIDGIVSAVPAARKDDYIAFARLCWSIFKDHGALEQWECWGDDVPQGKLTSFPMAVQAKDDEVVVMSWLLWPDRAAREAGFAAAMADPRFEAASVLPFDGKRMIFGGFDVILAQRA